MEKMGFGRQAEGLSKAAIRMLFTYKNTVNTITSDNGFEFAQHELIAKKLSVDFYFGVELHSVKMPPSSKWGMIID